MKNVDYMFANLNLWAFDNDIDPIAMDKIRAKLSKLIAMEQVRKNKESFNKKK